MPKTEHFSSRVKDLHPSPIREVLSAATRPGMVSFAGGLPSPESFPHFDLDIPAGRLQYGPTEGDEDLRRHIAQDLKGISLDVDPEQILVISGSQQGLDLVAKLFIDSGTAVAVESPTYLAALQVFRFYGARFVSFSPNRLEPALAFEPPAFLYAIPTFQNPTGHCYSKNERNKLALFCERHGVTLFEDDPYRDLVYDPCETTPICARIRETSWIYQGSFSKSLAPGLRLGFLAASPDLVPYLIRLKQAADLHSNRVSQWLVLKMLEHPGRQERVGALRDLYRRKRDDFSFLLEKHFSHLATWEIPKGGLFFWLKLKDPIDTRKLLQQALDHGVAFMPGEPFFPEAEIQIGTLRLNFSHASEKEAGRGLTKLADLLRKRTVRTRWSRRGTGKDDGVIDGTPSHRNVDG